MQKKILSLFIVILMIFTMCSLPISAQTITNTSISDSIFPDMPNDWSQAALENAYENGLLGGIDGKMMPNAYMTRAQMATILNRAFNAKTQLSISKYTDVKDVAWYYNDMQKALAMKTFQGNGTSLEPNREITREEAFLALARAFKIPDLVVPPIEYTDANNVSSWAKGAVYSLISLGYVSGYNGMINPKGKITRKEFAQVMYNIVKQYINEPGEYTKVNDGNVMINVKDVSLRNVIITGDLIIGDGVGDGDITLDNVIVEGRTVIRGGGINSIIIRGASKVKDITVSKSNGAVRVKVEEGADVEIIYVDDGKDDVFIEGEVDDVNVEADVPITFNNANVKNINVKTSKSNVTVSNSSTATNISVNKSASESSIKVEGKVNNITTKAEKTRVNGSGELENIDIDESATETNITSTGKITNVVTKAQKTQIEGTGEFQNIEIKGSANDTKVTADGVVKNITTKAPNTEIDGLGLVTNVKVKEGADDTKVSTKKTSVQVSDGVKGTTGSNNTPLDEGKEYQNGEDETDKVTVTNENYVDKTASYQVSHYTKAIGENSYILYQSSYFEADIETEVIATSKSYEGYTLNLLALDTIEKGIVRDDDSLVLRLYYDENITTASYTVEYYMKDANTPSYYLYQANNFEAKIGNSVTAFLRDFDGYSLNTLAKDTIKSGIVKEDNSLVLRLYYDEIITAAPYIVEHYRQSNDLQTYELYEVDKLEGEIDSTVLALLKTYKEYKLNPLALSTIDSGVVKEDGSLVLKLYYDKIITTAPYSVEYYIKDSDSVSYTLYETDTLEDKIGNSVSATIKEYEGYDINVKAPSTNMSGIVKEDASLVLKLFYDEIITTASYSVSYYKQNEQRTSYILSESESFVGEIGELANAKIKTYEGYTYNQLATDTITTGTILKDNSLNLKVYYDISTYNVNYYPNTASGTMADGNNPYSYNQSASVLQNTYTKSGYRFIGWNTSSDGSLTTYQPGSKILITDSDINLYAMWELVPPTVYSYTIEHYLMNPDNTTYTLDKTSSVSALANASVTTTPLTTYQNHKYDSSIDKNVLSGTNNGSLVLKIYYANAYSIDYYANIPQLPPSSDTNGKYLDGEIATIIDNSFTYTGYHFVEWNEAADGSQKSYQPSDSITVTAPLQNLYAIWAPNTDTEYTVEHYIMNSDFTTYSLKETETKTGTTNTTASAISKSYVGYTFDPLAPETKQSGTIVPQGATWTNANPLVLKLYYEAIPYHISYDANTGTGIMTDPNSPYVYNEVALILPNSFTKIGYSFAGWNESADGFSFNHFANEPIAIPSHDITIYALWQADYNTPYTVNHHLMDSDFVNYSIFETENLTGESDKEITAKSKTYPGYTLNTSLSSASQTKTVLPDGSLVIDFYYDASPYTVTYLPNGAQGALTSDMSNPYVAGENLVLSTNPFTYPGYTFDRWNTNQDGSGTSYAQTEQTIMPANDLSLYATWKAKTDTPYTVKHYLFNSQTGQYDLTDTDISNSATTDTTVSATPNTYTGYVFNNQVPGTIESGIVLGDGSLVLNLYYVKIPYTVSYLANGASQSTTDSNNPYTYGDLVTVIANSFTYQGYNFVEWNLASDGSSQYSYDPNDTFTMPNSDVDLYAIWEKDVDTTSPTVSIDPSNGSTNIATNKQIVLTFSEPIRNIDDSELTNFDHTSNIIDITVLESTPFNIEYSAVVSQDKTQITISPNDDNSGQLIGGTHYQVTVNGLEDAANNALAQFVSSFSTTYQNNIKFYADSSLTTPVNSIAAGSTVYVEIDDMYPQEGGSVSINAFSTTDTNGTNVSCTDLVNSNMFVGAFTVTNQITSAQSPSTQTLANIQVDSNNADIISVTYTGTTVSLAITAQAPPPSPTSMTIGVNYGSLEINILSINGGSLTLDDIYETVDKDNSLIRITSTNPAVSYIEVSLQDLLDAAVLTVDEINSVLEIAGDLLSGGDKGAFDSESGILKNFELYEHDAITLTIVGLNSAYTISASATIPYIDFSVTEQQTGEAFISLSSNYGLDLTSLGNPVSLKMNGAEALPSEEYASAQLRAVPIAGISGQTNPLKAFYMPMDDFSSVLDLMCDISADTDTLILTSMKIDPSASFNGKMMFVILDPNTGGGEQIPLTLKSAPGEMSIHISETEFGSGLLSFNEADPQYMIGDSAVINLSGPDFNTDPNSLDTVIINVLSTTDTIGINITLTENAPDSGLFSGQVTFQAESSNGSSLQVQVGDLITAQYGQNEFFATANIIAGDPSGNGSSGSTGITGTAVDSNSNPIANVSVQVYTANGYVQDTTDAQGQYALPVSDGAYYIEFYADYYNHSATPASVAAPSTYTAHMQDAGMISGSVNCFNLPENVSYSDIVIKELYSEVKTYADSMGNFTLKGVPGGDCLLSFSLDEDAAMASNGNVGLASDFSLTYQVSVTNFQTTQTGTIELQFQPAF